MTEWASEKLLDFLAVFYGVSVENIKPLSRFSVKSILTKYIADHNIPRKHDGTVMCDEVLTNLFSGLTEVTNYEMFEFVDMHFKVIEEYASIDRNNISLMYLSSDMILYIKNDDTFHEKAIGSFVKVRKPSTSITELLPVKCISTKNVLPYKVNGSTRDIDFHLDLIIGNNSLSVPITEILEDESFTDAELRRLQNRISKGIIDLPTVDFIHNKALALQPARAKCWQLVENAKCRNNPAELEEINKRYERKRTDIHVVHIDPRLVPS